MWKTVLKYVVTVGLPQLITVFAAPYLTVPGAVAVGGLIGGIGARVLHVTPVPPTTP